jgi:hypothetical protein
VNHRKVAAATVSRTRLASALVLYYISNTAKELAMDFIRRLQPKDWTIAIIAFIAGAWIF